MRVFRILLVLACLNLNALSEARTWRVEQDASGDHTIIQEAIDAAASGDTIMIGPGRFDDFTQYTYPGGTPVIVANVNVPNLTIIGAGRGVTIIGPEVFDGPYPDPPPLGIAWINQDSVDHIKVSGITFENLWAGIYVENGGPFSVDDCEFTGGLHGIEAWSDFRATNCCFHDLDRGLISSAPADSVLVTGCDFGPMGTSAVYFQITGHPVVEDCVFEGEDSWAVGVQVDRCGAELRRNRINGFALGISFSYPQLPTISDCTVDASYYALESNSEGMTAENNVFKGGTAVFNLYTQGHPHTIRNNHIIKGEGYAVRIVSHNGPDDTHIDMTGNYWGTAERDSIAAWIYDGNDHQWPPLECFVDFEPFAAEPVPAEKTSLGGLKSMFRGR